MTCRVLKGDIPQAEGTTTARVSGGGAEDLARAIHEEEAKDGEVAGMDVRGREVLEGEEVEEDGETAGVDPAGSGVVEGHEPLLEQ